VTAVQAVALSLVAVGGTAVVFAREPLRQAMVVGVYGFLLAVLFFLFQAPDVALSEIVVSTVALPLMILLALAKIRQHEEEGEE
jgi:energy-converting hydrogenase B subunit D